MTSRSSRSWPFRVLIVGTILIGSVACGPAAPGATPSPAPVAAATVPPTSVPTSTAEPSGSPSPAGGPSPSVESRDRPPDAALAAEGGDPVTGQLGTYLWLDSGSDSPWLPGARIAVGAGEPLSVRLDPATEVLSWRARSLPAGSDGPDGATTFAEGAGDPVFVAPGPGAWTVEVFVEFAVGAGEASYFWRLEVE